MTLLTHPWLKDSNRLGLCIPGFAVSPSNPASSNQEISRQLHLCKSVVAFATAELASNEFESMMRAEPNGSRTTTEVLQSDTATIVFIRDYGEDQGSEIDA
ncbi:hypothetical protein L2E82_27868 [Cichorium intybus]|uniref:Uncharacterized protein n=1 Tax=Cichorium intybus TaxID=13427 RepID=A0ACB9CU77_CICIN|nr:hypothetical protein L2E82_27868 [Cichorium intybus]